MQTKIPHNFLSLEHDSPNLSSDQRELYRENYVALSIRPILYLFIALGFGVIYLLGLTRLLDTNEPRLLIVSAVSMISAVLHLPIYSLMRREKLKEAALFLLVINSASSAIPVFLWNQVALLPVLLMVFPTLIFVSQSGLRRSYRIAGFIFNVVISIAIFVLDRVFGYERMNIGTSLTQMAALAIFIIIMVAMFVLVLLNTRIKFRTISGRLVAIFTFISFLSALATLMIAALANLYYDRQRILLELDSISSVRTKDVEVALDSLVRDANLTLTDPLADKQIQYLLTNPPGAQSYQENITLTLAYLNKQKIQNSKYQEILLIDNSGKVISSTQEKNNGLNISNFDFFLNALMGINYAIEYDFPASFDKTSLLIIKPYNIDGFFKGAIVVRSNFDGIKQILASKTGIGNTFETYMVGNIKGKLSALTNTNQNIDALKTSPAEQALLFQINKGSGIWNNYVGKSVLGSFVRIPALKTVLIAEIEQQEVTQKTINISLTNSIIGLFTLLLAFAIVYITSQSISIPIVDLANKAVILASGDLATRIQVNRQDEIGTLASSFNHMAGDLQILVQTLEKRVEDRTQDLQKQANYLRVAAEVARDATNANSLDELLNRAALLILNRFGFYHTGIFLLDEYKEYAVLRASPTQAGREMLARNHRLKVGQVGIVGNVASSGVSRIALDTGLDSSYFNNPLLPNTRSEIALPLKVNNQMIGVLDVQSDKPEAFTQDDINILQIMADQLALAIQRVRLAQQQDDNLREVENAYQRFTLSSWKSFSQGVDFKKGYKYDGMRISQIGSMPPESQQALISGRSVVITAKNNKFSSGSTLAVPLMLRDGIIGVLAIEFNTSVILQETIDLVEETAGRLAIALENARLYTETQMVAERERAISQVSSNIGKAVDVDTILRAMVEELGNKLQDVEVAVQMSGSNDASA